MGATAQSWDFIYDEYVMAARQHHRSIVWQIVSVVLGPVDFSILEIHKVPSNDVEALKFPLMGLFEKRCARKFLIYVQDYVESDPISQEGIDLNKVTTKEVISKYGLYDNTIYFIGHALALHSFDSYLHQPAMELVKRLKVSFTEHANESLAHFQGGFPYNYPLYGLGELPQESAHLSVVYDGTYMLNKSEYKVEFDEKRKCISVTSKGETAKCKKVVCDPSYLLDKIRAKDLELDRKSDMYIFFSYHFSFVTIIDIIPLNSKLELTHDMYIFCCSYSHKVAPKGKYIAFVSAEAKTDNAEQELKLGVDLLGAQIPLEHLHFREKKGKVIKKPLINSVDH
ncbi:hypothetical protein ACFE04_020825 [Oxalis oulophora]